MRRKFVEVVKAAGGNKTGKAGQVLKIVAKLYEIEQLIKGQPPDKRCRYRQQQARPILEHLLSYLQKIQAPKTSLLGKAVYYALSQWEELVRYRDYGEAELSNCWVENEIRPFAVGRRNWLFIGNQVSAQRAALLYSLIQSCLMNEINPRDYLEYVLDQVHALRKKEIEPASLLPHKIEPKLITIQKKKTES